MALNAGWVRHTASFGETGRTFEEHERFRRALEEIKDESSVERCNMLARRALGGV